MKATTERVRIALQKKGRLADGSIDLLARCGLSVKGAKSQLMVQDETFGLEFIFARDDDIPEFVQSGVCDLGIVGDNLLEEYAQYEKNGVAVIMPLAFSRCRLSIATPKRSNISDIKDVAGKTIATSYPNTIKAYLDKNDVSAKIVVMHGSVELAPQIGVADIICDLVASGATLNENGLKEVLQIKQCQAVLIRNGAKLSNEKQLIVDRLIMRINGVLSAKQNRYIMLHIDKDKLPLLAKIMPGAERPTVLALNDTSDKVAVHVVSQEDVFWATMEKLKAIGASSILVLPIEKMVD
ncbi:ATP phosphoribosyltransferase [Deferribacterales bacterium RsTz2092]|nr:ATP phosphoribosyltransferase [Deferribacterales bacterium]